MLEDNSVSDVSEISRTSSAIDDDLRQAHTQTAVRKLLKSMLFVGEFTEKRHIKPLNTYRDVVEVNPGEVAFINNLIEAAKRFDEIYGDSIVRGFDIRRTSFDTKQCTLFVKLPKMAFGRYWFKVKSIQYLMTEICIELKCIRQVCDEDFAAKRRRSSPASNDTSHPSDTATEPEQYPKGLSEIDWNQYLTNMLATWDHFGGYLLLEVFTRRNAIELFKFLIILLPGLVSGGFQFLKLAAEFAIQFVHEMGLFVQSITPVVVVIVDFLTKFMGATFVVINGILGALFGAQRQHAPRGQVQQIEFRPPRVPNGFEGRNSRSNAYNYH